MSDKSLAFTATMTIEGRAVTMVHTRVGPGFMATHVGNVGPTRFRFYHYVSGAYRIQVDEGKFKDKWIGMGAEHSIETSESPYAFFIASPEGPALTLPDFQAEVTTVHLQSPLGWFVQQRMSPKTAFDDPDVLYNFLLGVEKKNRGDGTYLAMVNDAWVPKPLRYNAAPAVFNLRVLERGID